MANSRHAKLFCPLALIGVLGLALPAMADPGRPTSNLFVYLPPLCAKLDLKCENLPGNIAIFVAEDCVSPLGQEKGFLKNCVQALTSHRVTGEQREFCTKNATPVSGDRSSYVECINLVADNAIDMGALAVCRDDAYYFKVGFSEYALPCAKSLRGRAFNDTQRANLAGCLKHAVKKERNQCVEIIAKGAPLPAADGSELAQCRTQLSATAQLLETIAHHDSAQAVAPGDFKSLQSTAEGLLSKMPAIQPAAK